MSGTNIAEQLNWYDYNRISLSCQDIIADWLCVFLSMGEYMGFFSE